MCDAHFSLIPEWRYFISDECIHSGINRVDRLPLHLQMLVSLVTDVQMFDSQSMVYDPSDKMYSFRTLVGKTINFNPDEVASYVTSFWPSYSSTVSIRGSGVAMHESDDYSGAHVLFEEPVVAAATASNVAKSHKRKEGVAKSHKRKEGVDNAKKTIVNALEQEAVENIESDMSDAAPALKRSKRLQSIDKAATEESTTTSRVTRARVQKANEKDAVSESSEAPARKRSTRLVQLQKKKVSAEVESGDEDEDEDSESDEENGEEENEKEKDSSMTAIVKEKMKEEAKVTKEVKQNRGKVKAKAGSAVPWREVLDAEPAIPKKIAAPPSTATAATSTVTEETSLVHSFFDVSSKGTSEMSRAHKLIFGNSSSTKALIDMKSLDWTCALRTKEDLNILGNLDALFGSAECADVLAIFSIEDKLGVLKKRYTESYCCIGFHSAWEVLLLFHSKQPMFDFLTEKRVNSESLELDKAFKPNYLIAIKRGFFHSHAQLSGNTVTQSRDAGAAQKDPTQQQKIDVASRGQPTNSQSKKSNSSAALQSNETVEPAAMPGDGVAIAQSSSNTPISEVAALSNETAVYGDSSIDITSESHGILVDQLLVSVRTDNLLNSMEYSKESMAATQTPLSVEGGVIKTKRSAMILKPECESHQHQYKLSSPNSRVVTKERRDGEDVTTMYSSDAVVPTRIVVSASVHDIAVLHPSSAPFARRRDRSELHCRNGRTCHTKDCRWNHNRPCRNGVECTDYGCRFAHSLV